MYENVDCKTLLYVYLNFTIMWFSFQLLESLQCLLIGSNQGFSEVGRGFVT